MVDTVLSVHLAKATKVVIAFSGGAFRAMPTCGPRAGALRWSPLLIVTETLIERTNDVFRERLHG